MLHVFIVNGYGVPKDIFKDDNYHFYLNMVFNRIWDIVTDDNHRFPQKKRGLTRVQPLILLSGGKTDCFPPYRRTEAGEMKKLFMHIMQRDSVRDATKHWKVMTQTKALTTVENLVYGLEIAQSRKPIKSRSQRNDHYKHTESIRVFYFCESTRFERSRILSTMVFPKSWNPTVLPIDFDVSSNRYRGRVLLQKREEKALQYELWALESSKNLKAWRGVYQERIRFLRRAGPNAHPEAVKEWWEKKLATLPIPT